MAPLDWMDIVSARDAEKESAGPRIEEAELLAGLNEAQARAVVHGDGPLLILAGAGTGKTRVITRRIGWLVATLRAAPHEILAITFTNKAANEMRTRVEKLLPVQGMWISTFHAACARILRRDIVALGPWTRDFSIYDTHDKNQLLREILHELNYDPQRFRPGMVGGWISERKSGLHERAALDDGGPIGVDREVFEKAWERYETALQARNALDFDDLLVKVLELFEKHAGIRDAYASRFRHVLVDEYQDTNHVQYLLTRHLAGFHGNLTVCGDPDQSIYAWRGADIRNILDFEQDFGRTRPVAVVKLERNYRSTERILQAAQALIRNNLSRKEKDLWTDKKTDVLVRVLECGDENDEAQEIVLQIHSLRARGFQPDQIALFYRANFMQRPLERALRLGGVPYQIVGGVEFYERREIRDLVSYLRVIVNPRDDVACARVLNVPSRGVGEKSAEDLAAWASLRGLSLLEAASSAEARSQIRGRARKGLEDFAALIAALRARSDRPAAEVLETVLDEIDYFAWLSSSGEPDPSREENVEELVSHARTYDEENPGAGLRGFLQDVALVSDVDAWDEASARVTLMTLHASKGLEFPCVFVAGLEEGLLPHALSIGEDQAGEGGVEEERRLLYVGMTRGMDELFLTHARTRLHYGETSWRVPSRFLAEIPPELVEGASAEETEEIREREITSEEPSIDLRIGDRVEHDHFGSGRIERLAGSGINTRVTVDFLSVGSKVLLVQYAKLRVVGR